MIRTSIFTLGLFTLVGGTGGSILAVLTSGAGDVSRPDTGPIRICGGIAATGLATMLAAWLL